MNDHLYDQLTAGGKRLARIPRFGRLIARMSQERLQRLTTEASTFWEVFSYVHPQHNIQRTGVIDSGLERGASDLGYVPGDPPIDRDDYGIRQWQRTLAMSILGAIAFEMYVRGKEKPLDRVEGDLRDFKQAVVNRCVDAGCYVDENGDPINKKNLSRQDWLRIRRLDVTGLQNLLFSNFPESDGDSSGGERILFTDITTQAFFAAYWAARWANDEDRLMMRDWIPDPWLETNMPYNEFWTFGAELPDRAIDLNRWQQMFAPLYDRRLQANQEEPIRSNELIYRSWERMEGHTSKSFFRSEFRSLLDAGNEVAKRLLFTAEGESQFVRLADKNNPNADQDDNGEFLMGSSDDDPGAWDEEKPQHLVTLTVPFALHRYCVTNAEFELFDTRRHARREFRKKVEPNELDRHPVVNVSWFDAWCFANWVGSVEVGDKTFQLELPTEAQWEYACRCGQETQYTWGDGSDSNKIQPSQANYDGYPNGRTVCVEGFDQSIGQQFPANPWGLHQMHGNVWEWCTDWYGKYMASETENPGGPKVGMARVLRGGGWINYGGDLRSAYRSRSTPSVRYGDSGFRLAAVPLSPASNSRASRA